MILPVVNWPSILPILILTVAGMVVLCWDLWMKDKDKWYLAGRLHFECCLCGRDIVAFMGKKRGCVWWYASTRFLRVVF